MESPKRKRTESADMENRKRELDLPEGECGALWGEPCKKCKTEKSACNYFKKFPYQGDLVGLALVLAPCTHTQCFNDALDNNGPDKLFDATVLWNILDMHNQQTPEFIDAVYSAAKLHDKTHIFLDRLMRKMASVNSPDKFHASLWHHIFNTVDFGVCFTEDPEASILCFRRVQMLALLARVIMTVSRYGTPEVMKHAMDTFDLPQDILTDAVMACAENGRLEVAKVIGLRKWTVSATRENEERTEDDAIMKIVKTGGGEFFDILEAAQFPLASHLDSPCGAGGRYLHTAIIYGQVSAAQYILAHGVPPSKLLPLKRWIHRHIHLYRRDDDESVRSGNRTAVAWNRRLFEGRRQLYDILLPLIPGLDKYCTRDHFAGIDTFKKYDPVYEIK